LWTPTVVLALGADHPFYQRLNYILDQKKFNDAFPSRREN
jgi:hypothetical protein